MKKINSSLLLTIIGGIAAFILIKFALKLAPEIRFPTVYLIAFLLFYYSDIKYKYFETKRQSIINSLASEDRDNDISIIDEIARIIYKGGKPKETKKNLSNALGKKLNPITDDLYQRAWRLNYPHFLDKSYYLKISAIKLISFTLSLTLGLILTLSTLVYNKNIYLLIILGVWLIVQEIYSKLWIWENYPPVTFPFYNTLKSVGLKNGIRFFILHYLINSILNAYGLSSLQPGALTLIYNNKNSFSSSLNNFKTLSITNRAVVLHHHSDDPKERYSQNYDSFNEFFKDFVSKRIAWSHFHEIMKYPSYLEKLVTYQASRNSPPSFWRQQDSPHSFALYQEFTNEIGKLKPQHDDFYKKGVQRFMQTPRYLFFRLFL